MMAAHRSSLIQVLLLLLSSVCRAGPQRGIPAQSRQALGFQQTEQSFAPQQQTEQQVSQEFPLKTLIQSEPLDKCAVADYEQIQCGQPDISGAECEAINCCYNGQQCYYGMSVTVQCMRDGQFVLVVARDVTLPRLSLDTVRLLGGNEAPCGPVGSTPSFAIYQFPVTACGTSMMEENGYVVYENRMTSSYEVGIGPLGSITRDSQFDVDILPLLWKLWLWRSTPFHHLHL
ncbi:Zona pellucida sperm-binding protein 1 [Triplophysa tibetana]|uniref:Zona pellucida sperm-binding protein 4 n=1 Tax=Triplophysa tibetana TaxID=1572043 RepID=A0A5A9NI73_9TELE|nr:Zona pellucida sperm-binding protein 1 [Triplophysa tibetana]